MHIFGLVKLILSILSKNAVSLEYPLRLTDMELEDDPLSTERKKRKEGERISLPPFGLASYKMFGDVWVSDKNGRDQERLVSLFNIADSWLKQLSVDHHDFKYFARSG